MFFNFKKQYDKNLGQKPKFAMFAHISTHFNVSVTRSRGQDLLSFKSSLASQKTKNRQHSRKKSKIAKKTSKCFGVFLGFFEVLLAMSDVFWAVFGYFSLGFRLAMS